MTASKIEWTDRSDWNPIRGCTRVSPGCGGPGPHGGCYAETIAGRFSDPGQAFHGFATRTAAGGRWTGNVEIVEDRLTLPLRWKKPAKVFASSTSDFFHEKLHDEDIDRLFAVMALAPHLTFQVLTKRSDRMRAYLSKPDVSVRVGLEALGHALRSAAGIGPKDVGAGVRIKGSDINPGALEAWPLPNVWLGVSVEDQQRADERREDLHATPAAVRFVSYEPALGPVDWTGWEFLDWMISGGESGPRARPSHPDWHRGARDFCAQHGIPYLFKQWGEWGPDEGPLDDGRDPIMEGRRQCAVYVVSDWQFFPSGYGPPIELCGGHGEFVYRHGKKAAGRLLDGVEHNGMPVWEATAGRERG